MTEPTLELGAFNRSRNLYAVLSDRPSAAARERGPSPGAKIPPEPELANQFGVSRTVIRDAVRAPRSRPTLKEADGCRDPRSRRALRMQYLAVSQGRARRLTATRLHAQTRYNRRFPSSQCGFDPCHPLHAMVSALKSHRGTGQFR